MTPALSPDFLTSFLEAGATAFATLFVVLDPIAITPLFATLTVGMAPARRRAVAIGAVTIAGAVLALFGLFGAALLGAIGIGMPAFRISGGLMLFLIALEMLFERRTERRARSAGATSEGPAEAESSHDPTVFPLATPLLAGPGAMATMVLLDGRLSSAPEKAALYLCLALTLLLCLGAFFAAGRIERFIGRSGMKLGTRLLGVLLGALAVQFVLDGLTEAGLGAG